MKELRFEVEGGQWRAAFAFDPERRAILLVAGDKSGGSRKRFYSRLIAKADQRFTAHLARLGPREGDSEMGRSLDQVIALLPRERQERIEARYRELKQEVESLRELRQIAGKAQADIAAKLNIKQPSVSKIEKQADMYLSTLRSYVKAIGGELELIVRLPERPALRLHQLGEAFDLASRPARPATRPRQRPAGRA